MRHYIHVSSVPFGKILRGEKVIESRLYDEKRQQISVGDEIAFTENNHPENNIKTTVTGLLRHPTFQKLFEDHEPLLFGGKSREFLLYTKFK